ncbi:hypothetical protein JVX93_20480 [Mycolicibacterium boenickei]|nr:hypothetical protein JVX93_20480 [Mycolicibacterium boenickei]
MPEIADGRRAARQRMGRLGRQGQCPAPKHPLFGLHPLATGDALSVTAQSAGVTKLRGMLKTAAVNDIVKQLQGLTACSKSKHDDME